MELVVNLPKRTPFLYPEYSTGKFQDESEIILKPNSKFKVISVYQPEVKDDWNDFPMAELELIK